jgi:hypothetical protein
MPTEHWQQEPEDHDFPAAANYLSLVATPTLADALADALRNAPNTVYLAKDLMRASRLTLLAKDNYHVAKDLAKVKEGHLLSPVLLVRGDLAADRPLVVADGFHRVCASYWIDENAAIPCRVVDLPH